MSMSLKANYGGLKLASPVVVGACAMTMQDPARVAIQAAGAGAIVFPSLFEEQVIQWTKANGRSITESEQRLLDRAGRTQANWACPDAQSYLSMVNRATVTQSIPIIASLNGYTAGGWVDFAGELQEVGAAAIELNVHHSLAREYKSSAEIETTILDAVRDINAAISIPLFVKLGRNFTSIPHLATQLLSGTQGLVLYGRAPEVDICLDTLKPASKWKLTRAGVGTESLETLMQVHGFCPAMALAASGGVAQADDLIKVLLAGADVAMVTSAIYREGPDVIRTMLDGLRVFMEKHHMRSLRDLQMQRPLEFSGDEERAAYIDALSSRLDSSGAEPAKASLHSDRWGHVTE
ncbi:dihydroorotate dehydrogenase-like protein [Aureliella helgolandensis]|uniref:Dihydroorotate dehydrogenase B (NAD(+)), catalytic subunit n=1 Tax=Aureliella helgolandensis TaxID=2527968 RepID=A0A518GCZ0_9BACT|nr:dihydroorotate dehydrogenase-like protein [Aureliella helgolandensis]QDV26464.1 Dihydroorotate dehydrogenase B (NAD(+)), catalytic subunit [Aureliella helgolandensis]